MRNMRTDAKWRLVAAACLAWPAVAHGAPEPQIIASDDADRLYCLERKLGTWFYCLKPKTEKAEQPVPPPAPPTAAARLEAITAQLRELKARAILEPSSENVIAYIRFQREQLDRSSMFSDVWQRALWQGPDLDYTLERPVSTLGKRQWGDARKADRDRAMASLSARYGLFYFFAQSCGPCEVMSPIIKSVADTFGITVRAISTDGGPSKSFPRYTVETNQRQKMGIEARMTPAVVLWDSATNRPIPIGYGVMSADELQDRIYLLTQKEPGRDY
jgi:conjugal transfer pilus assembly protein TraF